jgi:hypothetical protein
MVGYKWRIVIAIIGRFYEMSVGAQITKGSIDTNSANIVWQAMHWLELCHEYNLRLNTFTEAFLEGLGYTSGEVAILKSAFTKMDQAWQVVNGQAALTPAEDLTIFAREIIGDMV